MCIQTKPTTTSDLQDRLAKLNKNQSKWNQLPLEDKLVLLEEIEKLATSVSPEEYEKCAKWTTETMMGISNDTTEGQFVTTVESVYPMLLVKGTVEKLVESYKVACGKSDNTKIYDDKLKYQKAAGSDDDIILPMFPLLSRDSMGMNAGLVGEWWFDRTKVQSVEDGPKPFDVQAFSDHKEEGVMVVLGAGNQSFLTLIDVLEGLFVRQRTVLLKHHPLRGIGLDPLMRLIMEPLYTAGYLDSCLDMSLEDNAALVYHPLVTALHMTGGKPTHDAIVWGSTPEERKTNLEKKTPKLDHAKMTSELGAVTPWIVTPGTYTAKELKHHAEILTTGVHANASTNCCAPKVLVLPKDWEQKDEFLKIFQEAWQSVMLPVAYYPGCQQRWDKYKQQYPNASLWEGKTPSNNSSDTKERQLAPPMMNAKRGDKEACVLPLLVIDMEVDLSTAEGKEKASTEYAFQNEPFCPVLTLVTMPSESTEAYMTQAVELSNDYLMGTLSCSMSVPTSMEKQPSVEKAIANLHYGTVAVNLWSALCHGLSWGGYPPKECLECVESGLGRVNNYLFVPHVQKTVVRAPSIWGNHPKPNPDNLQSKKELDAVAAFVRQPGVLTFVALLSATIKVPPMIKWGFVGAVAAAVTAVVVQQQ